MRGTAFLGKLLLACVAALAIVTGCKTMSAEGGAATGGADGGIAAEVKSAGQGLADAGAAAAGAARDAASTAAQGAANAASGVATTASEAARGAAQGASQAMDGGTADAGAASGGTTSADGGTASADAGAAASGGASATAPSSDGQILAIVHAANQGEIQQAQLAKKQTRNARVREFASMMIKDHGDADAKASAWAKKAGVTAEESDTSRSLQQDGKDTLDKLKPLKGKEFDRAYVDAQVKAHQQVLSSLDDALIPAAKDPGLSAFLRKVRAKVAAHLEHARTLQSQLGS